MKLKKIFVMPLILSMGLGVLAGCDNLAPTDKPNNTPPNSQVEPDIKPEEKPEEQIITKNYAVNTINDFNGDYLRNKVASEEGVSVKDVNIENPEWKTNIKTDESGKMTGWNTREYVLFRDNHTCQHCKGKSRDNVLEVHHLESRKTGGNAPNNLITLCKNCHEKYHKGEIELKQKRGTKYNDAYCIANNLKAKPLDYVYHQKKIRCHNRQIHKSNFLKGGKKKLNQAPYNVKGFRLFDKVLFEKQICFIFGRRSGGYFDIRKLDGTKVNSSVSFKKLLLIEHRKNILSTGGERCFFSVINN